MILGYIFAAIGWMNVAVLIYLWLRKPKPGAQPMSELRKDPKVRAAFDAETLLGLAIRIADAAFDEAAKIKPWPCPVWCTLGEHSYCPRQVSGGAVERTHMMEIHEETISADFSATIMQLEIREADGSIDLCVPFAKIKLNGAHMVKPDELMEFAKTLQATAENLGRIQA